MRRVSVSQTIPGTVHEAESCWYDTTGWPAWVDGLERVEAVSPGWPQAGATASWQSGPAGRGHVRERVVAQEALAGQTVEVSDDSIEGRQSVRFIPADGGEAVDVELSLEYEISQRSLFTGLIDALFIRRAMEASLRGTLARFASELEARRARAR